MLDFVETDVLLEDTAGERSTAHVDGWLGLFSLKPTESC